MTELEKKANYYEKSLTNDYVENTYIDKLIQQSYKDGYEQGQNDGYKKATERAYERQQDLTDTYIKDGKKIEQLQKENEELKAQIEKMKRCQNCKYHNVNLFNLKDYDYICCGCAGYNQWELPE